MADGDAPQITNEEVERWFDGFANKYPDLAPLDDAGKRTLPEADRKRVVRAIEDLAIEDETLKSLSDVEAARKVLHNPRVYHDRAHKRAYGQTLVEIIRADARKKGYIAY